MAGPRSKELTIDEETVEVLEVIEQCQESYDLDEDTVNEYYDEY